MRADRLEVLDDPEALPPAWDARVAGGSPVLQRPFHRALAAAPMGDSCARFALAWSGERLLAAAAFHLVPITPGALGQAEAESPAAVRAFFRAADALRRGRPHLLISGHALHTDAPAAAFAPEVADRAGLLHRMAEATRRDAGRPVALVVVKAPDCGTDRGLVSRGYHRVDSAQPTMRLPIDPGWGSFDAYLDAMRSKYRQRARSARKWGDALTRTRLDASDIRQQAGTLDALLAPVLDRADVVFAPVTAHTLAALKEAWGDALQVRRYDARGQPVGFSSSLLHGGVLEGFLVGMADAANGPHKLYQNVLYDFVEDAIDAGAGALHLGRTALEIKSAVGAQPQRFPVFVRAPGLLLDLVLGRAVRRLERVSFQPRHPFPAAAPQAS